MPRIPTTVYPNALTRGQLARHWQKPNFFVDRMIREGKLIADESGLIPHSAWHAFMRNHAAELD